MLFDIRQLRFALAAAHHGSFSRAARSLGIDQSTLSRNVSKLERVIGVLLFERSRTGIRVTVAGSQFLRAARPLVANATKMVAAARATGSGCSGHLIIGHNNTVLSGAFRNVMLNWGKTNPDVALEGYEEDTSNLLTGLESGDIDMAITVGDAFRPGIRREPLWSEPLFIAMSDQHPLSQHKMLGWSDIRSESIHLTYQDPGSALHDVLVRNLAALVDKPDIAVHHLSRESILALVSTGSGISLVCATDTSIGYSGVTYIPLCAGSSPIHIQYYGHWLENSANPALVRFLKFLARQSNLPLTSIEGNTGG